MALSLSGNLIETPFSDVIAVLRQQKATGTLTCGTGTDEKSLYVKNGHIIFATSKDERDRLGEIMVKIGKITRGQLDRALKLLARGEAPEQVIEQLSQALTNKFLHDPMSALRDAADDAEQARLQALLARFYSNPDGQR